MIAAMERGKTGEESAKPATKKDKPAGEKPTGLSDERRRLLRVGVLAIAIIVGLIAWVATRDGEESTPAPTAVEPHFVSVTELTEFADSAGHPVYWAGTRPGTQMELRQDSSGQVFLRYLQDDTALGGEPAALTVGTYPLSDPTAALEAVTSKPGAITRRSDDGREVISNEENPDSVYFASPDNTVQVEVYAPPPKRAMSLALSDQVEPLD
jgi:hypothetical protein